VLPTDNIVSEKKSKIILGCGSVFGGHLLTMILDIVVMSRGGVTLWIAIIGIWHPRPMPKPART
jgi:hypothetical protein